MGPRALGLGGREVWARTIDWEVIRALDGKLHNILMEVHNNRCRLNLFIIQKTELREITKRCLFST